MDVSTNVEYRKNISRIRLSCHKLQIEIGRLASRALRLEPEERICKLCDLNTCEDEVHFISICPKFCNERRLLFQSASRSYPNFDRLDSEQKLVFLMSNEDIIKSLGIYITQCFLKRTDYLNTL